MRVLLATACLALELVSCSDPGESLLGSAGNESGDTSLQELRQQDHSPIAGDSSGVGRLVSTADVLHAGTRIVEVYDDGLMSLAYRERISTDGEGAFSLRPIEALTSVGPDWEPIQLNRQGFLFRYRDFSVRDTRLFAQNHRLIDVGQDVVIAGRPCARYRVERLVGTPRYYEIAVDLETGQTLSSEEFDQDQRPVARMTYETYESDPDLASVIWFQPTLDETPLLETESLRDQTGYPVPYPRSLPTGYFLHEAATLQVGNREWVKQTFTDGTDPLFFLFRPTRETVQTVGSVGIVVRPAPEDEPNIYLSRLGAAGCAQATLADGLYVAVGKVSEDDLVSLIETAFP